MPADINPPELAALVDLAERPRRDDWSLRAALVRYAQPQPQRVEALLDVVRRIDWALTRDNAVLARDGDALWHALQRGDGASDADASVVALLQIAADVDRLGDVITEWAVTRSGTRPDTEVDRVVEDARRRLDALGVPQQDRPPGPRNRG